jgi:hypothetical protein
MNSNQVRETIIRMLPAESGCEPDQLSDGELLVVARVPERKSLPEHRAFNPHPGRITAVTLGTGAVVSVDTANLERADRPFTGLSRDELFSAENLNEFVRRGKSDNLTVFGPFPRFTASLSAVMEPEHSPDYSVRVIDIEAALKNDPTITNRQCFLYVLFPEA